jgi:undecaprenyl-diphosphatase
MRWITNLGGARVTVGVALALLAFGPRPLGVAVAVALSLSHVAVQVLKRAVARPRPCDANGRPLALVELPDPFSFPSGHAAASMAVAGAISVSYPLASPALLSLAALVAYSRVALRVHHVGDVIAGAALGLAGVAAASALL